MGFSGLGDSFVYENWGCCAWLASWAGSSPDHLDHVFHSRRGPVAGLLYAAMLVSSIGLVFVYKNPVVGPLVLVMSMCVIGVHGMLSGTASMDFGDENVGIAVGIIDGFVYLGPRSCPSTYAIVP
ncbi:MAG: hypothetical protein R3E12_18855 [Candidatus Eisenbacteria bacterium]